MEQENATPIQDYLNELKKINLEHDKDYIAKKISNIQKV